MRNKKGDGFNIAGFLPRHKCMFTGCNMQDRKLLTKFLVYMKLGPSHQLIILATLQ